MEERRRHPRIRVSKEAVVRIEDRINPLPAYVEDISASGVRLILSKKLFPEVFSRASLETADELSFNFGASVRWQEEYEGKNAYGLSFNWIDEEGRRKLNEYIQEKSFKDFKEKWWEGL